MRSVLLLTIFAMYSSCVFAGEAPPIEVKEPGQEFRLAVPSAADIATAKKLIQDIFKNEYAQAKAPAEKLILASKLLEQGQQTNDDPAAKYTCLSEALRLAVEGGSLDLSEDVIKHISEFYAVDAAALNRKALADVLALSRDAETQRAVAALKTLETNPTDEAANLTLGKFLCFNREMWAAGLPYLAASNDEKMKAAATEEIGKPTDAVAVSAMADAWWDIAAKETEPRKGNILRHAGEWYRQALPELSGLTKAKIEKRIREIPAGVTDTASKGSSARVGSASASGTSVKLPSGKLRAKVCAISEGSVTIHVNAKQIGTINKSQLNVEVDIGQGDTITAKVSHNGNRRGLILLLQYAGSTKGIVSSTSTWKQYTPASEVEWFKMTESSQAAKKSDISADVLEKFKPSLSGSAVPIWTDAGSGFIGLKITPDVITDVLPIGAAGMSAQGNEAKGPITSDTTLKKVGGKLLTTVYACIDNEGEIYVNGNPVLKCDYSKAQSADIELSLGDVIAVKCIDTGREYAFAAAFTTKSGLVLKTSLADWMSYKPADSEKWWIVPAGSNDKVEFGNNVNTPGRVKKECNIEPVGIWPQGVGGMATGYVYHVVKQTSFKK